MLHYDKAKIKAGYWSYCFSCDRQSKPAYAYTGRDAREHYRDVHGYTQAFVDMWWDDANEQAIIKSRKGL